MTTEEQRKAFVEQKLEEQLSKFNLELDQLPEEKQEELKNRVHAIAESDDMKSAAMQEFKKTIG